VNALVAILAGTLVAASIVIIGGTSLLRGERHRRS